MVLWVVLGLCFLGFGLYIVGRSGTPSRQHPARQVAPLLWNEVGKVSATRWPEVLHHLETVTPGLKFTRADEEFSEFKTALLFLELTVVKIDLGEEVTGIISEEWAKHLVISRAKDADRMTEALATYSRAVRDPIFLEPVTAIMSVLVERWRAAGATIPDSPFGCLDPFFTSSLRGSLVALVGSWSTLKPQSPSALKG